VAEARSTRRETKRSGNRWRSVSTCVLGRTRRGLTTIDRAGAAAASTRLFNRLRAIPANRATGKRCTNRSVSLIPLGSRRGVRLPGEVPE
jgi:hypothetical protein